MSKGTTLWVASFVLGLLGASAPAMARPEYTYVNAEIFLKLVDLNTPHTSASISKRPPTVKAQIRLAGANCTLEVFKKSYPLEGCDLRNDSTLITHDHSGFHIKDAVLIKLANDIVRLGEVYGNDPAVTAAADEVLKGAASSMVAGRMTEITNIYRWDGADEDSRLSAMLASGGRNVANALVIRFDLGGVYEFNRATR
jgi:hypothetical protein